MNENKPNKPDTGALSWIFIVIAFSVFWPLGLFLLISRLKGKDLIGNLLSSLFSKNQSDSDSGTEEKRGGYTGNASSNTRGSWQTSTVWPPRPSAVQTSVNRTQTHSAAQTARRPSGKEHKSHISRVSKGAIPLQVFGWILLGISVLIFLDSNSLFSFWAFMRTVGAALSGAGLLLASFLKKRKEREFKKCVKTVGNKSYIHLLQLSKSTGIKTSELEKDIEEMIGRGYFGDAAYYDKATRTLIVDPVLAQQQLQKDAEAQAASRNAEKQKEADAHKDQYQLLLDELGRSVSGIRDAEMSEKAKLIYSLASAIFNAVREDEEKRPKLASFLNYYFPTTIKLLNTYSEFESQGYQGETLSKSRERIEGAADRIITAYRKQLDALYLTDTIDVDSDIDVLETMLKRDGLADSDFNIGTPGV